MALNLDCTRIITMCTYLLKKYEKNSFYFYYYNVDTILVSAPYCITIIIFKYNELQILHILLALRQILTSYVIVCVLIIEQYTYSYKIILIQLP